MKKTIENKSIIIVGRNLLPGGAERVIVQLANYFANKNIDVTIITIDSYDVFFELDARIDVIKIGTASDNKLVDKCVRYSKLRSKIMKIRPGVVLSLPEDVGIYVLLAMIGTGIPVFVSERNNPWVMPDVRITRLLRKMMYPFASGIIFQTEMAKSFFSKRIQNKGTIIGNPVDISRIPDPYIGERKHTIAGVGRLAEQKNFELLINAFSDFNKTNPEYNMVIYGEGDLRERLEKLVENLNLKDKVSLPGAASDVLEKINSCAMFVLSSDYEGMPNVLLEAMCMGMPVISTDCPSCGPRELIKNGKNGFLVSVGDKTELVSTMNKMTDIAKADAMGTEALSIRGIVASQKIFMQWEQYLFSEK